MKADFHCHSTASDGALSPTEVVELARQQGVGVLALTDHDSTEGVAEARRAAERCPDFTLIPGVEMGTDIPGAEVHVLGYFVEPDDPRLREILRWLREARRRRGQGMVRRLRELGLDISWEHVSRLAGDGAVGRPHVAQALFENGQVATVKEAFDRYIHRNGPAYVQREKMTPAEATAAIREMGGVACLAHPWEVTDSEEKLHHILTELKEAGLVAAEVYYKDYDQAMVERLLEVTSRFDLLALGGSDYHGIFGEGEPLPGGMKVPVPDESIDALLSLGAEREAKRVG